MSDKAKGKQCMIDVMAEAAETMTTLSPIETAASSPLLPISPPAGRSRRRPRPRKRWESRELRQEQEYGELLDSIIL